MKETSRMSSSRFVHGSRPSTFNSPSYDVRPRIALSAVVLPAPFGPIIPRMRPSSTCKSMSSRATVVPNVLRRPRASIVAMALVFFRWRSALRCGIQLSLCKTEPLDLFRDPRPFVGEKFLAFAFEQLITRTRFDEHTEAALHLDQVLIDQLLIRFEHGKRIDPELGCDGTHRWQWIAFVEHAIEDHMHASIAKLAIDRLSVIPFTIHPALQTPTATKLRAAPVIARLVSYSDIGNYNTRARASFFLKI